MLNRILAAGATILCLAPAPSLAWSGMSYDVIEGTTRTCSRHANEFNAGTCTLAHCRGSCEVVATYRDTCAAFVIEGDRDWHVSFDHEPDRAVRAAFDLCRLTDSGRCRLEKLHCDRAD